MNIPPIAEEEAYAITVEGVGLESETTVHVLFDPDAVHTSIQPFGHA